MGVRALRHLQIFFDRIQVFFDIIVQMFKITDYFDYYPNFSLN